MTIMNNLSRSTVNTVSEGISPPTNGFGHLNGDVPGKSALKGSRESISGGVMREQWGNPLEFVMSCISLSVGLGNIWRFPYAAFKNGGGAFLIPYLVVLVFIGHPVYFLEIALGQFSSYGQVKVWGVVPIFRGIGYGSLVVTVCILSYYAMLMSLAIFYLFASMQKTLPWTVCDEKWINNGSGIVDNLTTVHDPVIPKFYCNSSDPIHAFEIASGIRSTTSVSQLYFENEVLKRKYQIDDGIGFPDWRLFLCLLLGWILIWASIVRGVRGSGKVAYFTAIFPFLILIIMLIQGVSLSNSTVGILYLLKPDWSKMVDAKVWFEAVGQCIFSLNPGFGPLIMFGSFNAFKHNSYRDAWIVTAVDTAVSLFAGITVFAVLGHLAGEMGVEISNVANGGPGPGLTFVSFAQALGTFDVTPQLFSTLFYLMLLTLGVGSGAAQAGSIVVIICDEFPTWKRWHVVTVVCILGVASGLVYITPGGLFIMNLVDYFGSNFAVYGMVMFEAIAIAWIYGLNSYIKDLEFMLWIKLGLYWKITWGVVLPVGLFGILLYAVSTAERVTYRDLPYPDGAVAFGWTLTSATFAIIPLLALKTILSSKGDGVMAKVKESLRSTEEWGPKRPKLRREWLAFKAKLS